MRCHPLAQGMCPPGAFDWCAVRFTAHNTFDQRLKLFVTGAKDAGAVNDKGVPREVLGTPWRALARPPHAPDELPEALSP